MSRRRNVLHMPVLQFNVLLLGLSFSCPALSVLPNLELHLDKRLRGRRPDRGAGGAKRLSAEGVESGDGRRNPS